MISINYCDYIVNSIDMVHDAYLSTCVSGFHQALLADFTAAIADARTNFAVTTCKSIKKSRRSYGTGTADCNSPWFTQVERETIVLRYCSRKWGRNCLSFTATLLTLHADLVQPVQPLCSAVWCTCKCSVPVARNVAGRWQPHSTMSLTTAFYDIRPVEDFLRKSDRPAAFLFCFGCYVIVKVCHVHFPIQCWQPWKPQSKCFAVVDVIRGSASLLCVVRAFMRPPFVAVFFFCQRFDLTKRCDFSGSFILCTAKSYRLQATGTVRAFRLADCRRAWAPACCGFS